MFFNITQIDYNSAGIFILLVVIVYYVSGFKKRVQALARRYDARHYLNTTARIKSLDYAPSAIITIDSDGLVVSWNGASETIFGYNEQEMIGEPLTILMPQELRESHTKGLERVRNSGISKLAGKTLDMWGITKKGVKFPIRLTIWKWNEGPNNYFTGIIRDISEEKKKEEEEANILQMHERGEDINQSGVWSWDILNDIVRVSDGFKRIFDIDKSVVDSAYLLRRVYYEDLKRVEEAIKKAFADKEGYKIRYRLVRSDGVLVEVEVNACTYFNEDNELINITGTIHIV